MVGPERTYWAIVTGVVGEFVGNPLDFGFELQRVVTPSSGSGDACSIDWQTEPLTTIDFPIMGGACIDSSAFSEHEKTIVREIYGFMLFYYLLLICAISVYYSLNWMKLLAS